MTQNIFPQFSCTSTEIFIAALFVIDRGWGGGEAEKESKTKPSKQSQ